MGRAAVCRSDPSGVTPRDGCAALARWPLVVSPMAGGPSTVELVVAAALPGACAFLAGGYKTADALAAEMAAVRAAGVAAFGVNLFVPGSRRPTRRRGGLRGVARARGAGARGRPSAQPSWDDDDYRPRSSACWPRAPPRSSFTFGVPAAEVVRALQAAGTLVV